MLTFFKSHPLLDATSAQWIGDIFQWALREFDASFFYEKTQLVLPNNRDFPGRADSVEAMAANLLDNVLRHAGLDHWPAQAADSRTLESLPAPALTPDQRYRNPPAANEGGPVLLVPYEASQVNDPQTLIASNAGLLGYYLNQLAEEPAPASPEQQPLVAELLGVYLGFGIMLANSAFAFKGGCGGCRSGARRAAYLSQDEATYALALFCHLKAVPWKTVRPFLKSHLRPFYKRALRQISAQGSP